MNKILLELARQLKNAAIRIEKMAQSNESDMAKAMEASNEIRGLFANMRLDLLIRYGQR